jgi:hydrogenase expression/formation protein HypC
MCLAIPGEILQISGDTPVSRMARVAFSGTVKDISLALVPEAEAGDYVLAHAGFAIAILDEAEAERTLDYLGSMAPQGPSP